MENVMAASRKPDWNELDFVDWDEFRRMAPSIIGLEIGRLDPLVAASIGDLDLHNPLVRVRFELKSFVATLAEATPETIGSPCAEHLRAALLALPLFPDIDDATAATLRYIANRLTYVYDRIPLIY